jgi:hypothetical protein
VRKKAKALTRFDATVPLARTVKRLHAACEKYITEKRVAGTKSKVEVGYFDLRDLIEYFNSTREASEAVVKARDILHSCFPELSSRD